MAKKRKAKTGRPALVDSAGGGSLGRYDVHLFERHWEWLGEQAEGNRSFQLRRMIDDAMIAQGRERAR